MTSPHKTHIRNLLNMFNYIIDHSDPLGIIQGQIAQFERNFTTPTQPLYLYIDPPKEDPRDPSSSLPSPWPPTTH